MASAENVSDSGSMKDIRPVQVGTRRSKLAIAQVDMIIGQLKALDPTIEYQKKVVSTMADENQVKSFQDFNAKSIWTEELEELLVTNRLDVVVHCLKDMPTQLPPSCTLAVIHKREDPRDVVVMRAGSSVSRIQDLPAGSVVGTSSVRRISQILRRYPHLKCMDVRGNVNTRLDKLDREGSPFSCLVLAAAGLMRLELGHRISQYLGSEDGMLYAPGQGALGLETREGDARMHALLQGLAHRPTTMACLAERSLMRTLEGGCSVPIGVESEWHDDEGKGTLSMKTVVVSLDGKEAIESHMVKPVSTAEEAVAFGKSLAAKLMELGAKKILLEINASKRPAES